MTKILITMVLLCAAQVAWGQACGVDPETDVPGGTRAGSHSNDPCFSGGPTSPIQGALPTFFQSPQHGRFLTLQSIGGDFAVSDQLGSFIYTLRFAGEDEFEVLKFPVEEVRNILPAAQPNDITITPPDKKPAAIRQQIFTSIMSNERHGTCSAEGRASVKTNSITAATKAPSADKRSQS